MLKIMLLRRTIPATTTMEAPPAGVDRHRRRRHRNRCRHPSPCRSRGRRRAAICHRWRSASSRRPSTRSWCRTTSSCASHRRAAARARQGIIVLRNDAATVPPPPPWDSTVPPSRSSWRMRATAKTSPPTIPPSSSSLSLSSLAPPSRTSRCLLDGDGDDSAAALVCRPGDAKETCLIASHGPPPCRRSCMRRRRVAGHKGTRLIARRGGDRLGPRRRHHRARIH